MLFVKSKNVREGDSMDLNRVWEHFLQLLAKESTIEACTYQKVAGIPFLYITLREGTQENLENMIRNKGKIVMKGKQLHSETIYVRSSPPLYVYRHRFYVPQEKMFCCGNLCEDCIRLKRTRS